MEKRNQIVVTTFGNVSTAEFPDEDNICVKMNVSTGGDWKLICGAHTALSAFAYRGDDPLINVDLHFESAFKTMSPYHWPRYLFTCFTKDKSGYDCLKGYGVVFLPTTPGRHSMRVRCFLPEPSSLIQRITSRIRGLTAEFVNPHMAANADGRFVRVGTNGYLNIELNVSIKTSDTAYQFIPNGTIFNAYAITGQDEATNNGIDTIKTDN